MLSAEQFSEWCEYYQLEPWGFEVEDFRSALIAANVLRAAGVDVRAEKFMLRPPGKAPPPADLAEQIKKTFARMKTAPGDPQNPPQRAQRKRKRRAAK